MFKKKVWLYKILAASLAVTLVTPVSALAAVQEQPVTAEALKELQSAKPEVKAPESSEAEVKTPESTTPDSEPTPIPEPTPTPDPTPTPTPTPDPTPTPTPDPTPTPTPDPTPTPTPDPTPTPTPDPTPTPTPEADADGGVHNADGTITYPNGDIKQTDGSVRHSDGSVTYVDGLTVYPNGDIKRVDGTILHPDGSMTNPDGSITPAEPLQPEEEAIIKNGTGSNEGLIFNQQIIVPPLIEESFRFVTVAKVFAIVQEDKTVTENKEATPEELAVAQEVQVYEEKSESSKPVGRMKKDGLCYVLKEETVTAAEGKTDTDTKWVYIESGVVRGFVKADRLIMGEEAAQFVTEKKEENLTLADALVEPLQNKALAYTKTTIRQTVVDKVYAIVKANELNIREGKDINSRIIGTLKKDALCYILADAAQEWVYVESGDVRGFVKSEYLLQGEEANKKVAEVGEENFSLAQQLIKPEENAICYYTLTSIKEGFIASGIRASMIAFAQQFVGNPYVWGGTSLTNGADCSGFVQSIYAQYGYTLPRTSGEQSGYGMQIPVEQAAPGDLIFYAKNGVVYHVVMYIGEGQVVHASTTKTGIKVSGIDTAHAVWATRIISDNDTENIEMVNALAAQPYTATGTPTYTAATEANIGALLGNFKLTAYCNCPKCCGQWSGGPTASGTAPTQGRTVAMGGIEFGTKLVINGQLFTVEDRGTPYGHVDIFMNNHDECNQFGVQYANVYLVK